MNLNPGRNTIIINWARKTYTWAKENESWSGEWPKRYPSISAGAGDFDVTAVNLWSHDTAEGIPFSYDLCCDGGMFILFPDIDIFEDSQIELAKKHIKKHRDVASLRVFRMKKVS